MKFFTVIGIYIICVRVYDFVNHAPRIIENWMRIAMDTKAKVYRMTEETNKKINVQEKKAAYKLDRIGF